MMPTTRPIRSISFEGRALRDDELDAVSGGDVKAECQLFQMLSNAVNEVVKNFSAALQNAARNA